MQMMQSYWSRRDKEARFNKEEREHFQNRTKEEIASQICLPHPAELPRPPCSAESPPPVSERKQQALK